MQSQDLTYYLFQPQQLLQPVKSEDEYLYLLRTTTIEKPIYTPRYQLSFPFPDFSNRIRYNQRIITNAATLYINQAAVNALKHDEYLNAFYLKQHRERVAVALNRIYRLLKPNINILNDLRQSLITNFTTNTDAIESTILTYYLLWTVIYCNMEVQYLYSAEIHPDNRTSIEQHFTRILKIVPPAEILLQPLQRKQQPLPKVIKPTVDNIQSKPMQAPTSNLQKQHQALAATLRDFMTAYPKLQLGKWYIIERICYEKQLLNFRFNKHSEFLSLLQSTLNISIKSHGKNLSETSLSHGVIIDDNSRYPNWKAKHSTKAITDADITLTQQFLNILNKHRQTFELPPIQ